MTDEIKFEIDHSYTDEAVCPHCGHDNGRDTDHDSTEYEEECGSCEREYRVTLEYSVHFTTTTFDRAAEEAERQKRIDDHQARVAADKAECSKWYPGARVRVIGTHMKGRTGKVANKELGTFVYVDIDPIEGEHSPSYPHILDPEQLEAE